MMNTNLLHQLLPGERNKNRIKRSERAKKKIRWKLVFVPHTHKKKLNKLQLDFSRKKTQANRIEIYSGYVCVCDVLGLPMVVEWSI